MHNCSIEYLKLINIESFRSESLDRSTLIPFSLLLFPLFILIYCIRLRCCDEHMRKEYYSRQRGRMQQSKRERTNENVLMQEASSEERREWERERANKKKYHIEISLQLVPRINTSRTRAQLFVHMYETAPVSLPYFHPKDNFRR